MLLSTKNVINIDEVLSIFGELNSLLKSEKQSFDHKIKKVAKKTQEQLSYSNNSMFLDLNTYSKEFSFVPKKVEKKEDLNISITSNKSNPMFLLLESYKNDLSWSGVLVEKITNDETQVEIKIDDEKINCMFFSLSEYANKTDFTQANIISYGIEKEHKLDNSLKTSEFLSSFIWD